jgi:galactose mutarotase-like enzyme
MSSSLHWQTELVRTGVILETESLSALVIASQGATIQKLVYKPVDIDILWKAPFGSLTAGQTYQPDSFTNWCEHWIGGWSTIFPNGGDACCYRGIEMGFHGEAGLLAWSAEDYSRPGWIGARFKTQGRRSPFKLEKTVSLSLTEPRLEVAEAIQNVGAEPFEAVWGHHPAFGAPFIDEGCRVLVPADSVVGDEQVGPYSRLLAGQYRWPDGKTIAGEHLDLSVLPSRKIRSADLMYLSGLRRGEYRIYNPGLKLQVTVQWPLDLFPYLWFWQEFGGTVGFPWYGRTYCIGLEPFSAPDARGLAHAVQTGTALIFQPGEIKHAVFNIMLQSVNE